MKIRKKVCKDDLAQYLELSKSLGCNRSSNRSKNCTVRVAAVTVIVTIILVSIDTLIMVIMASAYTSIILVIN